MLTWIIAPALITFGFVLAIAITVIARHRSNRLKRSYGPEYDRVVLERGNARSGEAVLAERKRRVEKFPLRSLTPVDREAFAMEWTAVQRRFVEDPSAAVGSADRLISRVMTDRGYPMTHFEQRAADISVSYPAVVQNYRAAHEIALRHADGHATTEDLRQAMIHYRSLFEELLAPGEPSKVEPINRRRGSSHERAS